MTCSLCRYCNSSTIDVTVATKFQLSNIFHSSRIQAAYCGGLHCRRSLGFFRQGIEQKKASLLLIPLHHYYNRCERVTFAVGRLSAIRYKIANWSACCAGYIMGKLCEIILTNLSDFQHYYLAISRAKKPIHHQIMT